MQGMVGIGKHVHVTRKTMQQVLDLNDLQRNFLKDFADNHQFFGTVISGNDTTHWNVDFDLFPSDNKRINRIRRNRIFVLKKGQDETNVPANVEECAVGERKNADAKEKHDQDCQDDVKNFKKRTDDKIKSVTSFRMRCTEDEGVEWDILPEGDHILIDPMKPPEELGLNKPVEFSESENFGDVFLMIASRVSAVMRN